MSKLVLKTEIPGAKLLSRGKVRDIYDAGDNLVIVTTDRVSAFDVVMNEGIPFKGIVLNQISRFWFEKMSSIVKNHVVSTEVKDFPAPFNQYVDELAGRSMLVKKANPFPVECIVRGYLAGSGWKEYKKSGTLHGSKLPEGLQNSSRLPEPVFTPSTKAETGHDENISFERMVEIIGSETAEFLRRISLDIYRNGADYALERGIIIADTKFEFGLLDGNIILIDEVLTPDSSRFWPKDDYQPGRDQASLDKQILRNYLETLEWDKNPPAPPLPQELIDKISAKYLEIYEILTGETLDKYLGE
ncbi:MAG: phosphoribosylaminoimidazolesuccinocarboxamide synthase [Calditrichia bacterium]